MKKAQHYFGGIRMTWKLVIAYALICGIVIGALMLPAPLKDTSLQSPGANLEFWILAALFVVLNCKSALEAGIKTFVFFLISQPVIYLVQVPFFYDHWGIFRYYPYWFMLTVACFPGGMIAWFVKKGNALSVLIMGVADANLVLDAVTYIYALPKTFPKMILAILFIAFELVFFTMLLFKGKMRVASFALILVLLAGGFGYEVYMNNYSEETTLTMAEGNAPYTLTECDDRFEVTFTDDYVRISYKKNDVRESGESTVKYTDTDGNEYEITLEYGDGICNVGE